MTGTVTNLPHRPRHASTAPEADRLDDVQREIGAILQASTCAKLEALASRPDIGPVLRAFCRRVVGSDDVAALTVAELDRIVRRLVPAVDLATRESLANGRAES